MDPMVVNTYDTHTPHRGEGDDGFPPLVTR